MSRHIIIGDVHGCYDELVELLSKLDLKLEDTLVFVGDLIHKGPDSAKCIDLVNSMADHESWGNKPVVNKCIAVQGNHEEKHARWLRQNQRRGPNLMKHVEGYENTGLGDWAFMNLENMPLWYQFWSGGKPFVVTHGGFTPGIEYLPSQEELQCMSKNKRNKYAQVLRTRYINTDGKPAKLSKEQSTDVYWAELYDGRFGHCFFGHQVFHQDQPREYPNCTALDLGCVYGGYLCAAIVENGQVSYETTKAHYEYTPFIYWAKKRPI